MNSLVEDIDQSLIFIFLLNKLPLLALFLLVQYKRMLNLLLCQLLVAWRDGNNCLASSAAKCLTGQLHTATAVSLFIIEFSHSVYERSVLRLIPQLDTGVNFSNCLCYKYCE